jgi:hypothetical protein
VGCLVSCTVGRLYLSLTERNWTLLPVSALHEALFDGPS